MLIGSPHYGHNYTLDININSFTLEFNYDQDNLNKEIYFEKLFETMLQAY